MFDRALKQVVSDYRATTVLLTILLLILIWRIYKLYIKPYAGFPTFPLVLYITYCTVMNKIPKHQSAATFFFQQLIRIGKRFQKEGVLLIWLPEPMLVILDKDAVKAFSNDQAALDKAHVYDILRLAVGNGLITSNGLTWKTHRKLLNPVFHVGVLKKKISIINESADILVKKLEESVGESAIDILELLKPCAFGNICEYILGLKMNIPENREINKIFVDKVENLTEIGMDTVAHPWLNLIFMLKFTSYSRKCTKVIEDLHSFIREIISEMRKNIALQQADRPIGYDWSEDEESRKSFAHILLDHHLKDNSFTMDDVLHEVITFVAGGYDSVSHSLLWNLFLLGHHPDVQDQAFNEVNALGDGDIKYEDLQKLKYLECVIKEQLRIYPTVPLYARTISKDMPCGKYNVPKGIDICFFPYLLHRDPDVYPDPENFDPTRFMGICPENYVPFSEGIRHCIGKRFAMMEIKVILAYILRNFRIKSLDRKEDVDLSWRIVLTPTKPLRFRFTPRKRQCSL